jgi:hypothetical protein
MAAAWFALFGLVAQHVTLGIPAATVTAVTYLLAFVAVALGLVAAAGYLRRPAV